MVLPDMVKKYFNTEEKIKKGVAFFLASSREGEALLGEKILSNVIEPSL